MSPESSPETAHAPVPEPSITTPNLDGANPKIAAPRSFSAFSRHRHLLRPALSCVGALGVGLAVAPLFLRPDREPGGEAAAPLPEIALARETTFLVTPAPAPGALLRGRLLFVAGQTDALGRAAAGGQVARHLVENGARVKRGDAIIEISSGASQRAVPAAEFRQNRAEQSQIAASDAQNSLAQRISIAQTRLRAAQDRVARSQAQVGLARNVVRRLQNGETVAPDSIPAPFLAPAPAESRKSRKRRKRARSPRLASAPRTESAARSEGLTGADGATQIAARQAEAARGAAQESARALQSAREMLENARSAARVAEQKIKGAAQVVGDVEARFDAKKASGSDVEIARTAQKDAQAGLDAAGKAVISAQSELAKREKSAATAQNYAQSSAQQAAKTLASARLEGTSKSAPSKSAPSGAASSGAASSGDADDAPQAAAGEAPGTNSAPRVTLDRAIAFAGAALEESRSASRDAERLHTEIESYQGQITSSKTRIESATQDLAVAQQRVMDSAPRPRFTTSYAPSSGIVTWISRLAREVGRGEPIFGIARNQRVAARFEDKSGLWRALKPGSVLTAFVAGSAASDKKDQKKGAITKADAATPEISPEDIAKAGGARAVELKISKIEAPSQPGAAARLNAALLGTSAQNAAISDGTPILISVPQPGQKATLSVPASALLQRGAATYLAVLAPYDAPEAKTAAVLTPNAAAQPDGESTSLTPAPTPTLTMTPREGEVFRLRWARVVTGRSDGLRWEIVQGLLAGARIVSQPDDLEAMGFAPFPTASNTIPDTNSATPAMVQASGEAPNQASLATPAQSSNLAPNLAVLVRLTPEAA